MYTPVWSGGESACGQHPGTAHCCSGLHLWQQMLCGRPSPAAWQLLVLHSCGTTGELVAQLIGFCIIQQTHHGHAAIMMQLVNLLCYHPLKDPLIHQGACRVQGRVLVPGTAFFEMATAAAFSLAADSMHGSIALCAVSIQAGMVLSAPASPSRLQPQIQTAAGSLELVCEVDSSSGTLAIRSSAQVHVHAQICGMQGTELAAPSRRKASHGWYPRVHSKQLRVKAEQATMVARLAAVQHAASVGSEAYSAHPARADAMLHLGAVPGSGVQQQALHVPVGLAALHMQHSPARTGNEWAYTQQPAAAADGMVENSSAWAHELGLRLRVHQLQAKETGAVVSHVVHCMVQIAGMLCRARLRQKFIRLPNTRCMHACLSSGSVVKFSLI